MSICIGMALVKVNVNTHTNRENMGRIYSVICLVNPPQNSFMKTGLAILNVLNQRLFPNMTPQETSNYA